MKTNIVVFKNIKDSPEINELIIELEYLKEKERLMRNPLLKDWFEIRNEIRSLERRIRLTQAI